MKLKSLLIVPLLVASLQTTSGSGLEAVYKKAPDAILGDWMVYGKLQNRKYKYYGFSNGSISVKQNQFILTTPGLLSASNIGNFDICEKGSGRRKLMSDSVADLYYLKFSKASKGSLPLGNFAVGRANRAKAFATFLALDAKADPVVYYLIRQDYLDAVVDLTSKKKAENILKDSWKVREHQIGVSLH